MTPQGHTAVGAETLTRRELRHPDGRRIWLYGEQPVASPWSAPAPARVPTDIEQRHDAISDTWLAIAAGRNDRPAADVGCPLCPGSDELPTGFEAAVFENRFPTFHPDAPEVVGPDRRRAAGACEVVVYTDGHHGSLSTLPSRVVARTVAVWRDRSRELWDVPDHAVVLPFENHGHEVGATMPHPHGQIYAFDHVPPFLLRCVDAASRYRERSRTCLHCDTVDREADGPRVVAGGDHFVATVPFAPRWPYEVRIHGRRHGMRRLADLDTDAATELARILQEVTRRYDALFGIDLPYLLALQDAPRGAEDWHLLVELLPPHRSAQRLKIRATVETVAGYFINDTRPEETAQHLQALDVDVPSWDGITVPDVHHVTGDVPVAPTVAT